MLVSTVVFMYIHRRRLSKIHFCRDSHTKKNKTIIKDQMPSHLFNFVLSGLPRSKGAVYSPLPSPSTDMKIPKQLFCSFFVVFVWKIYFDKKCSQITNSNPNIQSSPPQCQFSRYIRPQKCTPIDLKYFVRFFPQLFEFASTLDTIKKGAILKTNFLGAPRWGHAAIVIDNPCTKDKLTTLKVMTMNTSGISTETWYLSTTDTISTIYTLKQFTQHKNCFFMTEKSQPPQYTYTWGCKITGRNHRLYAINPKQMDDTTFTKILNGIVKYNATGTKLEYDTIGAISSAFSACFTKSTSHYIKQKLHPTIEKNVIQLHQVYISWDT